MILGAQIIDLMMLVVDVTKGVQTQTAECLVIGEITCPQMIVVLNKVDLIPEAKRDAHIEKVTNEGCLFETKLFCFSSTIFIRYKSHFFYLKISPRMGVRLILEAL